MELDYTKLGKLIATCKENGVSKLEISDSDINVFFEREKDVVNSPVITDATTDFIPGLTDKVIQAKFDEEKDAEDQRFNEDDMLHLTDPVEWQRREFLKGDGDLEETIAVGGDEDEEDGDFDV